MTERTLHLLQELKNREGLNPKIDFIDHKFPIQKQILQDSHRFQLWNCTRRGAKSNTAARSLCMTSHDCAGAESIYMALTLDSSKAILWSVIEELLEERKINFKPYKQQGYFEIEAGVSRSQWSKIRFFGVDASYREMRKILGRKLKKVLIDEAGSITVDMPTLVYQMIMPALIDLEGFMGLLGTCENIPNTFFESVLSGKDKMSSIWKKYIWDTYQNPYMAAAWEKEIKSILAANPKAAEASWFRTHYLNQWCADDDLLIIKHGSHNETTLYPRGELFYVLGVDLGFNDSSSFTVTAFSSNDHNLYVLESFKRSGMDFTDVASTIKGLQANYPFYRIIVDGSAKQGVEELRNRHQLPLIAAEKTDKATFLRALKDDYVQGNILVHASKCSQLIQEQSQLMWLKDAEGKEDPRCENHCNDSLLYAWRDCKNYMFKPEKSEWKPIQERMEDQFKEEGRRLQQEQDEISMLF